MDARRSGLQARYYAQIVVVLYNHTRLLSAIGYVTPADKLAGLEPEINRERDRKLCKLSTGFQEMPRTLYQVDSDAFLDVRMRVLRMARAVFACRTARASV